jgi:pimeloyl-ACP methyl ester carboxylesterase
MLLSPCKINKKINMFEPFIPPSVQQLQDADAIALLRRIDRQPVTVPDLISREVPTTVPTAVVTPRKEFSAYPAPLLLLHGFDSSLLEFRHLLPPLEPHWPLYAVDLLGSGFTAHLPSVDVNPATIRQHLYCTWKSLIDRPVTLLGASLGGAVAIDFALNHPDCVERLILIDSVGFSGSFPLGKWLFSPLVDWGADWLHFRKNFASQAMGIIPVFNKSQQDLVLCSSLHQAMPGWKEAVKSFTRSGGYSYLKTVIPEVPQPTLIIWGNEDKTLGTEDARRFEQAIAHSRLVWVKGGNHAPHIHYPRAVAKAITEYLGSPETNGKP